MLHVTLTDVQPTVIKFSQMLLLSPSSFLEVFNTLPRRALQMCKNFQNQQSFLYVEVMHVTLTSWKWHRQMLTNEQFSTN